MKKNNRNLYPFAMTIPAIIIYSLFAIVPIIMGICLSFTDWNIKRWQEPVFSGLLNYQEVLSNDIFFTALKNTMIYAFSTSILKVIMGLALALVLAKAFKGNGIFRTIFYLPCVISITVIGVLFSAILAKNGLFNNVLEFLNLEMLQREWLGRYGTAFSWIIFIDSWMWAGFNMFIFISGLQAISQDYYEVADIEGASKIAQFFKITVPLLIPAITVNTTLNIAGGMKVFDIVYVLTNGGPGTDTQVLATFAFRTYGIGLLGESSAANIILTVLVIVISLTLNRIFRNMEVEL
ncbi:MAG: sugar ABC transporter permease [Eubacteriales bacterium]